MSLFRHDRLVLDIGKDSWSLIRLRHALGGRVLESVHSSSEPFGATSLRHALTALGTIGRGSILTTTIASCLVRTFSVSPPPGAKSLAEIKSICHARFQQLYSESPNGWTIDANWHIDRSFVACAIRSDLMQEMEKAATGTGVTLGSTSPSWSRAVGLPGIGDYTLCVVSEPTTVTLIRMEPDSVVATDVRTFNRASNATAAETASTFSRYLKVQGKTTLNGSDMCWIGPTSFLKEFEFEGEVAKVWEPDPVRVPGLWWFH